MMQVIARTLNQIMKEEAIEQAGAGFHEKSEKRKAHLNGHKKRRLITRYGPVTLDKPQLREKSFETSVFDKYDSAEKSIIVTICLNYAQGISTRKMKIVLAELGVEVSKSAVSRICDELDLAVREFLVDPWGLHRTYSWTPPTSEYSTRR
jgi:transposase-like protein